jgi:hypothetical protein
MMRPCRVGMSPQMALTSVLFPAPFAPTMATLSLSPTSILTSDKTLMAGLSGHWRSPGPGCGSGVALGPTRLVTPIRFPSRDRGPVVARGSGGVFRPGLHRRPALLTGRATDRQSQGPCQGLLFPQGRPRPAINRPTSCQTSNSQSGGPLYAKVGFTHARVSSYLGHASGRDYLAKTEYVDQLRQPWRCWRRCARPRRG